MGGRKQKIREPKSGIYVVGEGITEQYYFSHIKKIFGFHCTIKPRFFGNTSVAEMKKKIEELLRGDIFIICVFDADVAAHNESERKKLEQLQNKFQKNKNLLFCTSLPSIEYWFLLHHEHTNRYFRDAKAAETALKKYISDYEKTVQFLEKEKWVHNLCYENKLKQAIERAKTITDKGESWSNIWKAIEILEENK
ncbi:MAG TPA: RloB domain-containing protein [Porphyromonadaceae bacterium]|nr:RloB domain-containing protein [Porphyromonadaceae bacterium]